MPWDQHNSTWNLCASQAVTILRRAGLDYNRLTVEMIRGKGRISFHPTIVIWVLGTDDKPLWPLTLAKISNMLSEEGALDMHVLITEEQNHVYPLAPDPILLKLWPGMIMPRVVRAVKSESVVLAGISIRNWGPTEDTAEPTIVIVVPYKMATYRWDCLLDRVSEICGECGVPRLKVDMIDIDTSNFSTKEVLRYVRR